MYTPDQVERMHADVAHANRVKLPISTAGQLELEDMLRAYAATLRQQVSDVETMLNECVPGGSIVDPQLVCDNIREWISRNALRQAPAQGGVTEATPRAFKRADFEAALSAQQQGSIPMLLFCPKCHAQHIDAPDDRTQGWDNPPHRSHLCHACGCIWRPADVPTTGVERIETRGKADNFDPAAPRSGPEEIAIIAACEAYHERMNDVHHSEDLVEVMEDAQRMAFIAYRNAKGDESAPPAQLPEVFSALAKNLVNVIDDECECVTSDRVWEAKERLQTLLAASTAPSPADGGERRTNYVSGSVDDAGTFHPTTQDTHP